MKRWLAFGLLAAIIGIAVWLFNRNSAPPEVTFSPVTRETVVSLLTTDGSVEPIEWRAVVAEREGRIAKVHVDLGKTVSAGQPLVTLADPGSDADIAAAASKLQSARAALAAITRGGPSASIAEIEGTLTAARVDRDAMQREVESLRRLVDKKAATQQELHAAEDKLRRISADIAATEKRRSALVESDDRAVAEAQVREAEQTLSLARRNAGKLTIRAPIAGELYEIPMREGDWVSPGTMLAKVGDTRKLRIMILVDEPDLGRVHSGQQAKITWDAQPDAIWKATVTSVPTQVVSQDSRRVGKVIATADNPEATLPVGANINVEIVAQVAENALTVPKEALRRVGGATGVFALTGETLSWKPIESGVSSVSRLAVRRGDIKEGDLVATESDNPMTNGMRVRSRVR